MLRQGRFPRIRTQPVTACEAFQRRDFFLAQFYLSSCAGRSKHRPNYLHLQPDQLQPQPHAAPAVAAGVSQRTIAEASPYLVYDQGIVNRDRGQRVFGQVFTEFAGRMAAHYRMQQGQARIKAHATAFARAEKEYGVPPAVIAAFWGLESDFGANMGNLPTLRSLVSLAYDCRRSQMFANETIAALKIIGRGDLAPEEMVGSWAGELGQTQFLPTHYFNYAVDYDGDGRRDLLRSPADVIGSTANYIANGLKWRRGEPWLQEVRVAHNLAAGFPWDQADLTIQLPRSRSSTAAISRPMR